MRGRPRRQHWRTKSGLLIVLAIFLIEIGGFRGWALADAKAAEASNYHQSFIVQASESSRLAQENQAQAEELTAIKAKYPNPTQQEIEAYIKTIFGKDAPTAIGVSHHECFTWDKSYPKCHLKTAAEDSIGLFQINLYNSKQWIHAGRIPGNTIAEKELWLENAFNNTLYAYWVYKTSGWNPWTSYTSGAYLH